MDKKYTKQEVFQIIDYYREKKIDGKKFCDDYYFYYFRGLDKSALLDIEAKFLSDVGDLTSRFSPYSEDHAMDPKAFVTAEKLYSGVQEYWESYKLATQNTSE